MKRMISVFLAAFLIFSTPVGALFVHEQPTTVEAKSFKRGGTPKSGITNFQKKQTNSTYNRQTTTKPRTGGVLRGLISGGLAGLFFGSLLAHWGVFCLLLGFLFYV